MARVQVVNNLKNLIKANNPINNNATKIPNKHTNTSKIIATALAGSSRPPKTAPKIDLFA